MIMKGYILVVCILLVGLGYSSGVQAQSWTPVIGEQELRSFMGGKTLTLADGKDKDRRGVYNVDGTGTLFAWGGEFDRRWEIRDGEWICMLIEPLKECYRLERSTADGSLYRVTAESTGVQTSVRDEGTGVVTVVSETGDTDPNRGGATAPSAEELAAKLANPANPVMKIGNNFDYVTFDGDLPGASDQSAFRYVFLTIFPFKLSNGNSILVRPGLPVMFNDPVPDGMGSFSEEGTDIADLAYDIMYTGTTKSGFIWGYGLAGTLPTASNDKLGKDLWGLGPEFMIGKVGRWGVVGGLFSHQWDVAGSGDGSINVSSLNYFYSFPMGGGWQFGAAPAITYNHDADSGNKLTLPLGIGVSKTTVLAGRPWTFQLQYWNNIERPDTFSAEHTIRLSILPVVSAPWNKGK